MMKIPINTPIGQFRWLALLEGLSYIILVFIAMPLKYIWSMPTLVQYMGMAHGILFCAYVLMLIKVWQAYNWSFAKASIAFIASLVPFGTFWFDTKIRNEKLATKNA